MNPYTFGTWTNQSVTVTLSASDLGGSGLAATDYTLNSEPEQTYTTGTPITISAEGTSTLDYWSVDNAGNPETRHSVTINIDLTDPTITGAPTTDANGAGWYNTPVTIHWTCGDTGGAGVATCPEDHAISTEGTNQTASGTVTDNAGNSATATSDPGVNIDLTAPTITYSGNQGSYTVDQTIAISCTAADALSGIASTDCQAISGSAASFGVGSHAISSTATDQAGNTGTGTVTFTVGVTYGSLCRLSEQDAGTSRSGQQLCAALKLAALGQRLHNSRMETAALNSYILLVQTQRGRGLTAGEAATLIQLAQSLR
jgi:hypothetical protein